MDFSYIIAYRDTPGRMSNLKKTISWLSKFNCEVILIEQDIESKIKFNEDYVNHIFTYSEREFNKSWACNCGALNSKSDILVFGDCDLIIDPKEFKDCINHIKTSEIECLTPFINVIDLEKNECKSEKIKLGKWKSINRPGRVGTNLTGGIVIYTKDAFHKIGGWNELFEGWGGEDDYMGIKSHMLLNCGAKPYTCFHMYHKPATKNDSTYEKNVKLFNDIKNLNKEEILQEIEKIKPTIGNIDKYKN